MSEATRSFRVVECEQGTPEWFAARAGRFTASTAGDMLAKINTGESAGRRNLRLKLVLERLTGRTQEGGFKSSAMQDGTDREADAIAAYEALTGRLVQRVGFLAHTDLMAGASLDGYVGDYERIASIKCRQPAAHLDFLRTGTIPADALAQIRHELWITGAACADYFCWSPEFPAALQSRLVTVTREALDIPGYEAAAKAFLAEVDTELAALATMADVAGTLERSTL